MSEEEKQIEMGPCCFCGKEIEKTEVDPCSVTVETAKEKWQVWSCHADCFKSRVTTETEIDLSPAHF